MELASRESMVFTASTLPAEKWPEFTWRSKTFALPGSPWMRYVASPRTGA
jgi:hypothetical protein